MTLSTEAANRKDMNAGLSEMQHRHFPTVAAIIRNLRGSMSDSDVQCVAEHFADELRKTNPRFDRKRFLLACK